jgi:hypothetical protein
VGEGWGGGKRTLAVALYVAVNAVAGWQIARGVEFLAFVWIAPVLLGGFLALRPRKNPGQTGFSGPRFDCSAGTT